MGVSLLLVFWSRVVGFNLDRCGFFYKKFSFVHHMITWISFLSVSFFLVCFIAYFVKYFKFVGIILTGYT